VDDRKGRLGTKIRKLGLGKLYLFSFEGNKRMDLVNKWVDVYI